MTTAHQRSSFVSFCFERLSFAILVAVSLLGSDSLSARAESDSLLSSATPNLPFGDINVVILTDIHSWLGSHGRHEPRYDADLGDVLSFWERLKEQCDSEHRDIFLVNNGDFVDGTGLSETMDGDNNPEYLIPLLEKMPYDAVNVGNHELYSKKNIEFMTRPGGYVDWWGDRYLTSNINKVEDVSASVSLSTRKHDPSKDPLGNRYKILHGNTSNLLVFGFLYNMRDAATGAGIEIEKVQTTVQQQWFLDILSEEDSYDAILVLAHMDLVDPLVDVIRSAIRETIGDSTSIVFATGHTHYRGFKQLEDLTMTFEAGRYMDTVGFVSFPRKKSLVRSSEKKGNSSSIFGHVFLDANKKVLFEDTLGFQNAKEGKTKNGQDFSDFIDHTRTKLSLDKEIGCAPRNYYVQRHVDAPDSLWGLYRDQVVPKIFSVDKAMKAFEEEATKDEEGNEDLPMAMLLPNGNWRYNLYNNASLVIDDVYAISPFNDTVVHLGIFSSEAILEANKTLNKHSGMLPHYILVGDLVGSGVPDTGTPPFANTNTNTHRHHLYTHQFAAETLKRAFQKIAPSENVEIRKTGFTSSLIWLAFVEKYWACKGSTQGELPDHFPYHQQQNNNVDDPTSKSKKATVELIGIRNLRDFVVCIAVFVMLWAFLNSTVVEPGDGIADCKYKTVVEDQRDIPCGQPEN